MKKYKTSIFIFTRDLRLHDNTSLLHALKDSMTVIPIFIFNPVQINKQNEYKSNNCVQFMCECLGELNKNLKNYNSRLFYFYDKPEKVIKDILKEENINAVYMNKDYTPFANLREENIKNVCEKSSVDFIVHEDYLLTGNADAVKNQNNQPYVKFTPFLNSAKNIKISKPRMNKFDNYMKKTKKFTDEFTDDVQVFYKENNNIFVRGGRENALKILKNVSKHKNYNSERDYLVDGNTTGLSAYLKFNVVSIREVYEHFRNKLPRNNKLITQLYWRDFYMIVIYHFPHVIGHNMKQHYKIKWKHNEKLFDKWKNGLTGFPIVDAGMRQMNETGYMFNRVRMIVANFLVKILHIDWREGEKYFAQRLVDYDPANNNGGWQWCASTGTDSQPYFRYFNPWSQAEKYDENCEYIKKWIPELNNVETKDILKWYDVYNNYKNIKYPKPIIKDIREQIKKTLEMFKQ